MILIWLIVILMAGGLLAWLSSRWNIMLSRWIALAATSVNFVITGTLWAARGFTMEISEGSQWMEEVSWAWIPKFGIHFHLALDGLSLLMILLTSFLGILSVLSSWSGITRRVGFFHFNLLWILAGITGVFLALDLFLFYFFWEVMLIPMYFLIAIWGSENRVYAAYKFFIFTQASGLLMLVAILGLYFVHAAQTGVYSFDYTDLLGMQIDPGLSMMLMLGFLIAFAVKLPVVPFHNWLPDAHTEAPTAGSVILAGLLLKTGAYGILRFVLPLFPGASVEFAPVGMFLGVVSIIYGAKLAFAQTDFKRLVAYTSVSHMGFVMLGVYAFNQMALQGVVVQLIAHGISTGALFIMAGAIYERIHTRDLGQMGGFWKQAPKMGAMGLVFVMASLGLPGLGNFVAEFLILAGAFSASKLWTILAALGLVFATVYSLRIMARVFYGEPVSSMELPDLNIRERIIMWSMVLVIVWLGLFPQPVLNTAREALDQIRAPVEQIDKPDETALKKTRYGAATANEGQKRKKEVSP